MKNKNNGWYFDSESDVLWIAKEGIESEYEEFLPGVNLEKDSSGRIIGIELLNFRKKFKEIYLHSSMASASSVEIKETAIKLDDTFEKATNFSLGAI